MIFGSGLRRALVVLALAILIWFGWPLYGFLSNQFEVARLPFGWHDLRSDAPTDEELFDLQYVDASAAALSILTERRKEILAPSLSAAVAIDGKLIWAGAVGWQDVAENLPITTNTAYRIGSTSKPVGITGLARLATEGRIELDRPIETYVQDLPNPDWNVFTPRQLASHTAGLSAYEENTDWIGFYQSLALTTRFEDPMAALAVFDDADTLFEPGTDFHYSGFDNVLLSAVVQNVAGVAFDTFMSSEIFDPLGMASTRPDHRRTPSTEFALSYQSKGTRVKQWRSVDLSHKLAAGGYVSTPKDLARLGAAWLDDAFISPDVRQTFWTPVKLTNGEDNEQNYALGFRRNTWPVDGVGDVVHLNHGGVSKGAQCWLMIVPDHGIALAISTNRRTDSFFDFADVYVDLLEVFIAARKDS
ncbi:MAG: serine hydrolase domain-containing protein [Pseudomonadota bacterium]